MPIHEKSLIRPENLVTHDNLIIDGVDVSGHWSTFIETRAISDYNEAMQDEIEAFGGGENISAAGNAAPAPMPAQSMRSTRISIRATGST